ncbi:MAG: NUDIX domain-containing protein [Chloroflexota bacterium]
MSFLRLGTACAAFDDERGVLLSRRGDLDVWNLPTGRLDSGEPLADAAAREAREETGVIVSVEHAVGLYYFEATQRLNVLYAAFPVGGEITDRTDESTANRYFSPGDLPESLFAVYMVHDAAAEKHRALHIHTTPRMEIAMLRLKLARRYVLNYLRGRPEPKHVRFNVRAVAVIWDEPHKRILTMPGKHSRVLPYVPCDGNRAPWEELAHGLRRWLDAAPKLHWAGVWQDTTTDAIEFVFAATVDEHSIATAAEWQSARNAALVGRDAQYISRIKATYRQETVWSLAHQPGDARIIRN